MKNKKGFTLAEIIISMTIIGVIAAITIPALLLTTSDKALNAQRKALLARASQAISQIEDLRDYAKSEGSGTSTVDKSSALNFIEKALSKVYRISKVCDKNELVYSCAFPENIFTQDGETIFKIADNTNIITYLNNDNAKEGVFKNLNTDIAGFVTANGESIVLFYNPKCYGTKSNGFYTGNAASAMCLNMIYDLNGKNSAPNEVGKDIGFITVFFPKDPDIVMPNTYNVDTPTSGGSYTSYANASQLCKNSNKELIIPTWNEGLSFALNKKLTNTGSGKYLVSGAGTTDFYDVDADKLKAETSSTFPDTALRCVYNK